MNEQKQKVRALVDIVNLSLTEYNKINPEFDELTTEYKNHHDIGTEIIHEPIEKMLTDSFMKSFKAYGQEFSLLFHLDGTALILSGTNFFHNEKAVNSTTEFLKVFAEKFRS